MAKLSLAEIPLNTSVEEFNVLDETKEVTGTFHYGQHAVPQEACNIANDKARKKMKKTSVSCFSPATPEKCALQPDGTYLVRAEVPNHQGSCGGREFRFGIEYPIYEWPETKP